MYVYKVHKSTYIYIYIYIYIFIYIYVCIYIPEAVALVVHRRDLQTFNLP